MILTFSRGLLSNDLSAVPWLVIISFSLLSKHVSDIVRIVLFKFVTINALLGEFLLPELHRLIDSESDSLQEESKLKSSKMLQMVLVP